MRVKPAQFNQFTPASAARTGIAQLEQPLQGLQSAQIIFRYSYMEKWISSPYSYSDFNPQTNLSRTFGPRNSRGKTG